MIEFNVAQLLLEPMGSERTYEIDETVPSVSPDDDSQQDWQGNVRLMRTDKGVLAKAHLNSFALCTCSRCLSIYSQPIQINVVEEFFPTIEVESGVKADMDMVDEEDFLIDHNHILDMTEAVRQYAVMALPMKPLCDERCFGLCQTCGVNLNEQTCQCQKSKSDPHWDNLLETFSNSKL